MALACRKAPADNKKQGISSKVACYVTLPDKAALHIEIDPKKAAQEILDEVSRRLKIADESAYFGLQYIDKEGFFIWLNMRNRIDRQIIGRPPYEFYLRVKYYIAPHNLFLKETGHQFYLNAEENLKQGLWDAGLPPSAQSRLIALMTYVNFGEYKEQTSPFKYACFWPNCRDQEIPSTVLEEAASYHRELATSKVEHAEMETLRIAYSEVPSYGFYYHKVVDMFNNDRLIGVGPESVTICREDMTVDEMIPYARLHTIHVSRPHSVTLTLLYDDGSTKDHPYRLRNLNTADSLYRAITEINSFLHSPTISDKIISQRKNNKDYDFDVLHTWREVSDGVCRRRYNSGQEPFYCFPRDSIVPGESSNPDARSLSTGLYRSNTGEQTSETGNSLHDCARDIEEVVNESIRARFACIICRDRQLNQVLGCGHSTCFECSRKVTQCPICRETISLSHPLYLPLQLGPENNQLEGDETHRMSPPVACAQDSTTDPSGSHRSSIRVNFQLSTDSTSSIGDANASHSSSNSKTDRESPLHTPNLHSSSQSPPEVPTVVPPPPPPQQQLSLRTEKYEATDTATTDVVSGIKEESSSSQTHQSTSQELVPSHSGESTMPSSDQTGRRIRGLFRRLVLHRSTNSESSDGGGSTTPSAAATSAGVTATTTTAATTLSTHWVHL